MIENEWEVFGSMSLCYSIELLNIMTLSRRLPIFIHYLSIYNTPNVPPPQCEEITPPARVIKISLK